MKFRDTDKIQFLKIKNGLMKIFNNHKPSYIDYHLTCITFKFHLHECFPEQIKYTHKLSQITINELYYNTIKFLGDLDLLDCKVTKSVHLYYVDNIAIRVPNKYFKGE